jgi:uncharacterized protein
MLWGASDGGLELRATGDGGARLSGSFPYNRPAVLSDGGRTGRPRKEVIAPRAFAWRVERPEEDIHLLLGHSFDKPLASRAAGTFKLRDTDEALTFEAIVTPEIAATSHGRDALALVAAGLAGGISPGFRLPPQRAVREAERVEQEPNRPEAGQHRAIIRHVLSALLYEVSIVTRPAYDETQIELRSWRLSPRGPAVVPLWQAPTSRWRA